jgi:hypothetical protein
MGSNIYTTAEERDKLNLMLHRFLIMGDFSKEIGLHWNYVTGLFEIVDMRLWMLAKIKYGI